MTESEKRQFNDAYKKHTSYASEIIEAANKITKPMTRELDSCIERVLDTISMGNSSDINFGDLEVAVLKIPSLCYYLQSQIGNYALQGAVDELINDSLVIEELDKIRGERGDAREKMKRAEATCLSDRVAEALNKQICINLKETIVRADKVYEGIKKVLDARSRENEYNRKSQMYST